MDNNSYFVSFDADDAGRKIGQAILSDNPESLKDASEKIDHGNSIVAEWAQKYRGIQYSSGGDQGVWYVPEEALEELETLRSDYEYSTGMTISVGVAKTLSGSGKSLLVAKIKGKNQIVFYGPETEEEIKDIAENVKEGRGSQEEQKLAEAYINPTTEPSNKIESDKILPKDSDSNINEPTLCDPEHEDNNFGYDSGYKNSTEKTRDESYRENDETPPTIKKPNLFEQRQIPEGVSTDIQESNRQMNEIPSNPEEEAPMIQKPAPKSYHGQAEGEAAPQSQAQPQDGKPSDIKYNKDGKPSDIKYNISEQIEPQADIPIENATSNEAEETEEKDMGESKHCPSCTCEDHTQSTDDVLDQHVENAKDFSDSLEQDQPETEMGEDQPKTDTDLLDQHLDNHSEMMEDMDEHDTSRPADYDEKEGDLGLSEDEESENGEPQDPDMAEVLQGGLDQHAQEIQKEKVVQLVGKALEGFKNQKVILDKAKEQAPELYSSCIDMLRSMIELCKIAGLDNSTEAQEDMNQIEGEEMVPNSEEASSNVDETAPNEADETEEKESCPTCGKPHEEKEAAPGGAAPFPKK